ncbi:hypothetical protein, partial [Acinetobacter baumannii]|uniref:hypothetical protein n=1 Tax=Acinetobacter baumannii TaxID=470 RepID=UPI001C07E95B
MYLVPKPPGSDDDLQWRLSYAEKEREILAGNNCAKNVIKLLKRLRDMQGVPWKKLCSYHLKNFVLLQIENYTWEYQNLGEIFT